MSDVFRSYRRTHQLVEIISEIADPVELARKCEEMQDHRHIGGLLLVAHDAKTIDWKDGTYTHTYVFHPLRYIDPRITHGSDDRQAKPI